jgi:hypothetical protein
LKELNPVENLNPNPTKPNPRPPAPMGGSDDFVKPLHLKKAFVKFI